MELEQAVAAISPALETAQRAHAEALGGQRYVDWAQRRHDAVETFVLAARAAGAKSRGGAGDDAWFAFAGIRSTSTQGVIGAARNWRTAAKARIERDGGKPC